MKCFSGGLLLLKQVGPNGKSSTTVESRETLNLRFLARSTFFAIKTLGLASRHGKYGRSPVSFAKGFFQRQTAQMEDQPNVGWRQMKLELKSKIASFMV